MVLQAIRYKRGKLEILDQLKLPYEETFLDLKGPEDAWKSIKSMQVRGAPAIAIVAALSLAVWSSEHLLEDYKCHSSHSPESVANLLQAKLAYLVMSRPTAVNLADAAGKLNNIITTAVAEPGATVHQVVDVYIGAAEQMLVDDVEDNENIGRFGADWLLQHTEEAESNRKISVLTHCNTGSLATAGYGTALGVIRTLHASSRLQHAFYTETRPYNQGCRLTGYEMIHDGIPATLITDSMAAALLKLKRKPENIAAIVVGADRVAANGDTANKIGTYSLAILAKYHGIKFIVAAPRTTIDLKTNSGEYIVIEERPEVEVTTVRGPPVVREDPECVGVKTGESVEISMAAAKTKAWNPAFDVTPAELIDAIVTEVGVVEKVDGAFKLRDIFDMPRVSREKK